MSVISGEPPSPDECVWYVCLTVQGRKQSRRGPMYYADAMQTVHDWMLEPMTHGFVTATPPAEYPDPYARRRVEQRPTFLYDDSLVVRLEDRQPAGIADNSTLTRNVTAANTTVESTPTANPDPVVAAFVDDMRRLRERWDALLVPPPLPPEPPPPPSFPPGTNGEAVERVNQQLSGRLQSYFTTPADTVEDEDEDE